jgi:hypothetical protein
MYYLFNIKKKIKREKKKWIEKTNFLVFVRFYKVWENYSLSF